MAAKLGLRAYDKATAVSAPVVPTWHSHCAEVVPGKSTLTLMSFSYALKQDVVLPPIVV